MNIIVIVLVVVLLLGLVGVNPGWSHSAGYGWGPSGIIGVLLVIVVILAVLGRI